MKLEPVLAMVEALYGDTSVPISVTRDQLEHLRERIDEMLEALPRQDEGDDL